MTTPDRSASSVLASSLRVLLEECGLCRSSLEVVDRAGNLKTSTSRSEVVTCRVDGRRELRILCKHEAQRAAGLAGHWRGVLYEAAVYRRVLEPLAASVPRLYGTYCDFETGRPVLALEYLDAGSGDASLGLRETGVARAAAWIGGFHRASESWLTDERVDFLQRFDEEFYAGWADRTLLFGADLVQHNPWLPALCRRFRELAALLVVGSNVVIHAEFYRENVLIRDGVVHPIDWESAAVGAAEIDLAALTEGWPPEVAIESESAYAEARWPDGPPAAFASRLDAARLYLHFRWLGDRPRAPRAGGESWRFKELALSAQRLGVAGRQASDPVLV